MLDKYENHENEYREEAARIRYEREQSRKRIAWHPHDPDYIAPDEDDEHHD